MNKPSSIRLLVTDTVGYKRKCVRRVSVSGVTIFGRARSRATAFYGLLFDAHHNALRFTVTGRRLDHVNLAHHAAIH
jgi:hypothetical protein